jgi:hypothetical protein
MRSCLTLVTVLCGLAPALASAATDSPNNAKAARFVRRYQRYFDRAYAAVVDGKVAPVVRYRATYRGASVGLGYGQTSGTGTVTSAGIEQDFSFSGDRSLLVGVGLHYGRQEGAYVVPRAAISPPIFASVPGYAAHSAQLDAAQSIDRAPAMAIQSSLRLPLVLGGHFVAVGTESKLIGSPRSSSLLRNIEAGQALASMASHIGVDLAMAERLGLAHQRVRAEKRELNALRAQQRRAEARIDMDEMRPSERPLHAIVP